MGTRPRLVSIPTKPVTTRVVELWSELREYIEIAGAGEILRRYFAMNAFDGALTMMGFVVGTYISGLRDPRVVLTTGISASFAMGVSGFVGALLTEKAERERKVRELERAMLKSLDGTIIATASKVAILLAAIVDAVAPALTALIISSPFILSCMEFIDYDIAVLASLAISMLLLYALGSYLGKISGGRSWVYATSES